MIALANQIKYSFSNVIRKILINADHTTVKFEYYINQVKYFYYIM